MSEFRWGIFGTGAISIKFAAAVAAAPGMKVEFVASRSAQTANDFAGRVGIPKAIEGYAEAARQGGVDAIYIATPPSEHHKHALLCIAAGIPVLVEKPFATSRVEAMEMAGAARDASVFAMEGMWTRFLPASLALKDAIASGRIGVPHLVSGSFGTSKAVDPASGSFDPRRSGGALAHLGVYPLSLAQWLFGSPESLMATGQLGSTGVDEDIAIQLRYPGGVIGSFYTSIRAWAPNDFQVMGTHGMLGFHGPIIRPVGLYAWQCKPIGTPGAGFGLKARIKESSTVHRVAQTLGIGTRRSGKVFRHRYRGNGFIHEIEEVVRCVRAGQVESATMPLDDSISVATSVEQVRKIISGSGTSP